MSSTSVNEWDAAAASFDDAADHGLRDPAIRTAWRALLSTVLPPPPARVADLGCGTGTLTVLMADMGYAVDGLDFSAPMLEQARVKAAGRSAVSFELGDAAHPPLAAASYDVVLSRHVLWALPDPVAGLTRWDGLLAPGGRLVLIEGCWRTGVGLRAVDVAEILATLGRPADITRLPDPRLWGREITDHRYVIVSRGA
jgi:ubiquinone/menaquinone biosynthesis C-methylase UbiE